MFHINPVEGICAVSYTHLDVYKRQLLDCIKKRKENLVISEFVTVSIFHFITICVVRKVVCYNRCKIILSVYSFEIQTIPSLHNVNLPNTRDT